MNTLYMLLLINSFDLVLEFAEMLASKLYLSDMHKGTSVVLESGLC